jgi:hypothetical protein
MRANIQKNGECVVGCGELNLLCRSVVSEEEGTKGMEQIAHWEGWTFERLARGDVRFCGATS